MSSPHKRHRERVPNLMAQSKKGVRHDTVLRPWSAMGALSTNKPRNEKKTWTTVPSTMSGGFNGGSSHRE